MRFKKIVLKVNLPDVDTIDKYIGVKNPPLVAKIKFPNWIITK